MIIRELRAEDLPGIESILDLYWEGEFRQNLSKRLRQFVARDPEVMSQAFQWFVAEDNGDVVGVAALRKAPEHLKQYATSTNPAEFYVAAVERKGEGIGSALRAKRLEEAKAAEYTEILFFSGESHKDSWPFHDSLFSRVAPAVAPNGEPGYVWRLLFDREL